MLYPRFFANAVLLAGFVGLTGQGMNALADEPPESELLIEEQAPDELVTDTVMGTQVYNANDDNVGSIDNLLIDNEGRVVGAVLAVGGFLGFGAKNVAVSWDHLTFNTMERIARLDSDIDRDWLEEAPEFRTRERIERERQAEQARQEQEMQMQQQQQTQQ